MSGIEALEEVKTFGMDGTRTRDLIVIRNDEDENGDSSFTFGEVPIHQPIPNDLQQVVLDELENQIGLYQDGKREILEYSLANVNRETEPIQYLSRDDFPMFDSIEPLVEDNSFPDSSFQTPRPSFQAIRIKDRHGRKLVALKKYTNRQVIKPGRKFLMFLSGEEYTKLEQDELVALPNRIDAVYFDTQIFVFNQKPFEDIFDWDEELQETVDSVCTRIESSDVLVHNMDTFKDHVLNDRTKMRKLYEVSEDGITDDLDMDVAEDMIDEFNLDLDIEENEEGEKGITVPNGHKVWDLIRLFNNDHLVSPVDAAKFQVYGKDRR